DHGLMAHKELCREVGQSFHAVTFAKTAINADHPSLGIYRASTYPPASSVLSAESEVMTHGELGAQTTCQLYSIEESVKAEAASRECLQKELESLSAEHEHLAQRFRQQAEKASQSESMLYKCLQVINQIASLAEEAQQDYRVPQAINAIPQHLGFGALPMIKSSRMPYENLTAPTHAVTAAAVAPRCPVVGSISEGMMASSPLDQSFASANVHDTRRSVVGARTVLSFGTNPTPFECTIVALKKENRFYVSA
ncbi:hypothetical protein BHE90_017466, partial [Fusarium euwallaceae]